MVCVRVGLNEGVELGVRLMTGIVLQLVAEPDSGFARCVEMWLLPYLERLEATENGRSRGLLKNYLTQLSKVHSPVHPAQPSPSAGHPTLRPSAQGLGSAHPQAIPPHGQSNPFFFPQPLSYLKLRSILYRVDWRAAC